MRKLISFLALTLILFTAHNAQADVAFNASGDGGGVNPGNSHSYNYTCSGNNIALLVVVLVIYDPPPTVSVTANGIRMTLAAAATTGFPSAGGVSPIAQQYDFVLLNAPSGTHTIAISGGNTYYIMSGYACWTGVMEIGVTQPFFSGSPTASYTTAITPLFNNSWIVTVENSWSSDICPSAGAGSTFRVCNTVNTVGAVGYWGIFDTNGPISPAALTSMTTIRPPDTTRPVQHVMIELSPSIGCAGSSPSWTALSTDSDAVQRCLNHISDGDTVTIPPGSARWDKAPLRTGGLGFTLKGTGTPDNSPNTFTPSSSCTSGSNTHITIGGGIFAIYAFPNPSTTVRISCLQLSADTSAAFALVQGACNSGGCPNLRMDNLLFDSSWIRASAGIGAGQPQNSYAPNKIDNMFGVIDHNWMQGTGQYFMYGQVGHNGFLGVGDYGDNSAHSPRNWGSPQALYFENNTFDHAGCCENESSPGLGAVRVVFRFNKINFPFSSASGTDYADFLNGAVMWHEENSQWRGGKQVEVYRNEWNCGVPGQSGRLNCLQFISLRGGTAMEWGNRLFVCTDQNWNGNQISCWLSGYPLIMNSYRSGSQVTPQWGVCDGTNVYDTNDTTGGDGTGLYFTGVASAVGTSSVTLTDMMGGPPGLTAHQWAPTGPNLGYPWSLHDLTQSKVGGPDPQGRGTQFIDNDTDTLYLAATWDYARAPWQPSVGDVIEVRRAFKCLDQPGSGESFLYTSRSPDQPWYALPAQSSAQTLNPGYMVMDTYTGRTTCQGGNQCRIDTFNNYRTINNRDFFQTTTNQAANTCSDNPTNQMCSPFNGSSGAGYGLASNRPSSCTPGAAYFENNVGNWNPGNFGDPTMVGGTNYFNGQMSICTAANVWDNATGTPTYKPFDYPHPLVNGAVTNPASQAFTIQPSSTIAGSAFAPAPQITLSPAASDSMTLSLNNCANGGLTGTLTITANGTTGNASWTGVGVTGSGTGCTLTSHNNTNSAIADVISAAFNITAPAIPHLTSVSPSSGNPNTTVPITLTGTTLTCTTVALTVSGANITVTSPTCVNATTITASLVIAANAASGVRTISATLNGATTTDTVNFTVTVPPPLTAPGPFLMLFF